MRVEMGSKQKQESIETSALENINVDSAFEQLMRGILQMVREINGYIPYYDDFYDFGSKGSGLEKKKKKKGGCCTGGSKESKMEM